jgi:hypothetical protein
MLGIDDLAEFPAVGQLLLKNPHANIRLKVFGVLQDIATYDTGHGAPKVATAHDGDLVERLGSARIGLRRIWEHQQHGRRGC